MHIHDASISPIISMIFCIVDMCQLCVFMPPTSKKLRRHIGLGLSVRLSVHPSVCYTCTRSRTVRDRILKLGMQDEYEN